MSKSISKTGVLRAIIAHNVGQLIEIKYKGLTNKNRLLADEAKVSLSTVQRIRDKEVAITIDSLEAISAALGISPYQLFLPNLNPLSFQSINGADKEYKTLRRKQDKQNRMECR